MPNPNPKLYSIVSQSQQTISALSGGIAPLFATWYSGGCVNGSTIVAAGCAVVNITLPSPTSVIVSIPSLKLTLVGDAAAVISPVTPTSSTIAVSLVFPTYVTVYTHDPRTIYDLSEAAGLFTVQNVSGVMKIVANTAARVGTGSLLVYFTNNDLLKNITITILVARQVSITVNPLPIFAGSASLSVTKFQRLGQTSVYQQGTIVATLTMTDASTRFVSTNANTAYKVYDVFSGNLTSNILTFGTGITPKNEVKVATTPVFGDFYIRVICFSLSAMYNVSVGDSAVSITSVQNVVFPRTLKGIQNLTKVRIVFDTMFSDSTIVPFNYVIGSGLTPVLPGLLSFAVDNTVAIRLDSIVGDITLLNNAAEEVTVSILALGGGEILQRKFFVNLNPAIGDMDLGALDGPQYPNLLVVFQFFLQLE